MCEMNSPSIRILGTVYGTNSGMRIQRMRGNNQCRFFYSKELGFVFSVIDSLKQSDKDPKTVLRSLRKELSRSVKHIMIA